MINLSEYKLAAKKHKMRKKSFCMYLYADLSYLDILPSLLCFFTAIFSCLRVHAAYILNDSHLKYDNIRLGRMAMQNSYQNLKYF